MLIMITNNKNNNNSIAEPLLITVGHSKLRSPLQSGHFPGVPKVAQNYLETSLIL